MTYTGNTKQVLTINLLRHFLKTSLSSTGFTWIYQGALIRGFTCRRNACSQPV